MHDLGPRQAVADLGAKSMVAGPSVIGAIEDEELRDGVAQIFRDAQDLIDKGELDMVVLATRRLACLYQLLIAAEMMPELSGCLVVSDRFLDVATEWKWPRVLIIDDSVVVGTTLSRLYADVRERMGGARGQVQCRAICEDRDQHAQYLLDGMSFSALHERPAAAVRKFAANVVMALYANGVPFFSDFPTFKRGEMTRAEWLGFLSNPDWRVADVTAPILGDSGRRGLSQIPTQATFDRLLSRIDPAVAVLVEGFKLRSFVEHRGSDAVRVKFVPIALLAPSKPAALDRALKQIAAQFNDSPRPLTEEWESWRPVAKYRLVQLFVAACVLSEAFDSDAAQGSLQGARR